MKKIIFIVIVIISLGSSLIILISAGRNTEEVDMYNLLSNLQYPKGDKNYNNFVSNESFALNTLSETGEYDLQAVDLINVCNFEYDIYSCEGIDVRYKWCSEDDIPTTCTPDAIQNAIDDITENGTVFIKEGEYIIEGTTKFEVQKEGSVTYDMYANIVISKNVNIKGEIKGGEMVTILRGVGDFPLVNMVGGVVLFTIESANMEVSDLIIEDSTDRVTGIGMSDNSKGIIHNMHINNNGYNGIVLFENSSAELYNNIISSNYAEGIRVENGDTLEIINNTIVDNSGNDGRPGGISIYRAPDVVMINNIVANNQNKGIYRDTNQAQHTGTLLGNYNNVWHNYHWDEEENWVGIVPGSESISQDPKFVDEDNGDYHLDSGSPSIDAGDPRICDFDDTRSDMGAFGGGKSCPGATSSLKFKIKLERKEKGGETYYQNDKVRIKLEREGGGFAKSYYSPIDNTGFGYIEDLGDDLITAKYIIYIKPDQYISKKLGSLLFKRNVLTEIHVDPEFRVGDVNASSYDFINALDFSLFIKYLREQDFERGDFNVDRAVNAVDYSIMLKTYREERVGALVQDPE